jgi:hypothetical protein
VEDGSQHQWHHLAGCGCLLPCILCLSSTFSYRLTKTGIYSTSL